MSFQNVHYLPVLIAVLFPSTFVLSYVIAVSSNKVSPLFPYISDTGTFSPESCIFGQLLNLGAVLVALVAFIRYLQLCDLIESNQLDYNVERLNKPSFILGILAALGISIVGNFQEANLLIVHLTGAILAFGVGGVYTVTQSYIAFKISSITGDNKINWIRAFLAAGTLIFFVSTILFAVIAIKASANDHHPSPHAIWNPGEAGWNWHFISALKSWLNGSIPDDELFDPREYSVFRRDRESTGSAKKDGSGVLIAVRHKYSPQQIDCFKENDYHHYFKKFNYVTNITRWIRSVNSKMLCFHS